MDLTVLYWILLGLMGIGVIGAIVPGLPGTSLILVSVLAWCVATGFAGVGWPLVAVFVILILSAGIDYLALYWGVEKAGASKWATFGSIFGLVLGVFGLLPALPLGGPLLGLLVGPVVGAFVGEWLYRGELEPGARTKQAFKACMGVVVGSLIGNVIEALLAIAAIVIFIFNTWPPLGVSL
ncbi:MAG: DUF456 family protein [Cyanobacteriota bacterium]|nr:DUF456 family protein [Cyanobacteriota bacterium]